MITYHFRVILLGDQYVGKSLIFNQLMNALIDPEYDATVGVDYGSVDFTAGTILNYTI
jgi:GTPase SAR1 family protein